MFYVWKHPECTNQKVVDQKFPVYSTSGYYGTSSFGSPYHSRQRPSYWKNTFTSRDKCLDFKRKYPKCFVKYPEKMGNKICDGSDYNTKECGWDGGDCLDKDKELWKQFPKCVKGVDPLLIGNGKCDNGGNENTEECGWDGGECFAFNLEYPNCNSRFAFKISNGICEDAMRRVGFMNSQKVEPAPKIFAISSSFGRKVFGNYPLYDSTQPTICIPVQ